MPVTAPLGPLSVETLDLRWPELLGRAHAALAYADHAPSHVSLLLGRASEPVILLGRHQRTRTVLGPTPPGDVPVLRRWGGGRAMHLRGDALYAALVIGAQAVTRHGAFSPEKLLNRGVRGVLRGLRTSLGLGVFYFGRDTLSLAHEDLGAVSQESGPRGARMVEIVIPAAHGGWLAPGPHLPVHEDQRVAAPRATWLRAHSQADLAGVLQEIAIWLASDFGLELVQAAPVAENAALDHQGDLELDGPLPDGFRESGVADIPSGFIEALVRADDGMVERAFFRGDFIMPSPIRLALESALTGSPLDATELGHRIDAIARRPDFVVHGLRTLTLLPTAVLAAAQGA